MSKNARVMLIPDTHYPAHHKDSLKFLKAVRDEYSPDRVIQLGDLVDLAACSYHEKSPDLPGPLAEIESAKRHVYDLFEEFNTMDLLLGNHDLLIARKAQTIGIPTSLLKSQNDIWEVPSTWKWHMEMRIKTSDGAPWYFHHSKGGNILQVSQSMGCSTAAGHLHEKASVQMWATSERLMYGVQSGCLVDHHHPGMAYSKWNLKRQLLAATMVLDGVPRLIPMRLNQSGRWIGRF